MTTISHRIAKTGLFLTLASLFVVLAAAVAAPAMAVSYGGEISTSTSTPRAGGSVDASGSGFKAVSKVKVTLTPFVRSGNVAGSSISLGTVTASSEGTASGSFKIPSSTTPGDYTMLMTGVAPDDSVLELSSTLTIRQLANTGVADFTPVLVVGGLALVAGVTMFVFTRKSGRKAE